MSCRISADRSNVAAEWRGRGVWGSEWVLTNLFCQRLIWLQETNVFNRWAEQNSSGLRSRTAVLFQIKMSVCVVSRRPQKAPHRKPNRSFSKVLLGYRPAWRWNLVCVGFLQLHGSDIMPNLLCLWSSRTVRPSICLNISVYPWLSVCLNNLSQSSLVCVPQRRHITRTLFGHNPFSAITPFVCWELRSQSCCHTSEYPPADTSGCAQESIASASCPITL